MASHDDTLRVELGEATDDQSPPNRIGKVATNKATDHHYLSKVSYAQMRTCQEYGVPLTWNAR